MSIVDDVVKGYLRVARLKESSLFSPEQRRGMQKLINNIGRLWEHKEVFAEVLFEELLRIFEYHITYDILVSALIYLKEYGQGIKPEEANKVFTLSGINEQDAPYKSGKGTLEDWKDLLAEWTILGLKENVDAFQLRRVASKI